MTALLLAAAGAASLPLWRARIGGEAPALPATSISEPDSAVAPPPEKPAPETSAALPQPRVAAPVTPAVAPEPRVVAPAARRAARPPDSAAALERPRPAPGAPAAPSATSFASDTEMHEAYEQALAFERSHDPQAAIARWKAFRARGPSPELDEAAKRRITDLALAGLQRLE